MGCYDYQRKICAEYGGRNIINIASKEDPGKLSQYGCINVDLLDFDKHTGSDLTKLPNFVHGDALNLPWKEPKFQLAVLGEFIEHCVRPCALRALSEAARVVLPGGYICVTYPLDPRAPGHQHAADKLDVWVAGETGHDITSWHQTVWESGWFDQMVQWCGLIEVHREQLEYSFVNHTPPQGYGVLLRKPL